MTMCLKLQVRVVYEPGFCLNAQKLDHLLSLGTSSLGLGCLISSPDRRLECFGLDSALEEA